MAEQIEKSSGNVFEDLGFPDAGEHQIKAWIVTHILGPSAYWYRKSRRDSDTGLNHVAFQAFSTP